jgi:hypothetical protein
MFRQFLDGVVGFGHGAEHPIRHASQVGAVVLEALGKKVLVGHRSRVSGWFMCLTRDAAWM